MKANKEQQAVPFFNVLSQLCIAHRSPIVGASSSSNSIDLSNTDPYGEIVAEQVWQCADQKPLFFLQWLERAAPLSPILMQSLLSRLDLWVEKFLLKQVNSNARQGENRLSCYYTLSNMFVIILQLPDCCSFHWYHARAFVNDIVS
jgi:hypothetical protein